MTPLGNLQNEGDLKRWIEREFPTPPPKPDVSLIKNGEITDEDFPQTPGDGTIGINTAFPRLEARIAGEWKGL